LKSGNILLVEPYGLLLLFQTAVHNGSQIVHGIFRRPKGFHIPKSNIHFSLIKDADQAGNILICIVTIAVLSPLGGQDTTFFIVAECVAA
jgi:hypothetical protein